MQDILTLTLFGSAILGWLLFGIFILFCFIADWNEDGFIATIALIIVCGLYYFWGRESFKSFQEIVTVKSILVYLFLGLIYAFIRVFFYGREQMKLINKYRIEKTHLKVNGFYSEPTIDYSELKYNVFRWWLLWIFSLINWFIKDMIKEVFDFIYQKMEKLFTSVLNLGMKTIKEVDKPNNIK